MRAFLLRLFCAGVLGLGALAFQASAQTDADFFNDSSLQTIKLVISPASWRDLQAHYLENIYYQAEFHWNFKGTDVVVNRIGIRSRGHGSRSPIKPNLHVSFGQYVSGQKLLGLSACDLKANNQDASQQRERITMSLFKRMGLPASRETHTRLYINDDYQGLYLLVEHPNQDYIRRYIGGVEGNGDLYEWKPLGDPGGYHFEWRPTCTFSGEFACSTDGDKWAPLPFSAEENQTTFDIRPTIQFMRNMTEASDADFVNVMGDYTDLKLFMVHNALEVYSGDFDTILGDVFGANNFWIYRYLGKNFHQFLVWDKDYTFNWSGRPIFQNTDQNVLMRRSLALPDRRYQYLEALHKSAILAGGAGGWMEWMNQRGYGQVRQAALDDPNKLWQDAGILKPVSNEKFESDVVYNVQFIRERYAFVIAALAQASFQPAAGGPTLGNGGAVNAATNLAGPVAPGSLVALYGTALTSATLQAATVPLPTTLGNVTVYVNGFPAPLLFVSPNQINLQIPWELGLGDGTAPFAVIANGPTARGTADGSPVNGTPSNIIKANVASASPAVFPCGAVGCVVQADGSLTSSKPAGAGDVLVVYANGLGAVDNPVATGQAAPLDILSRTLATPAVLIGNVAAEVLFSGLTPGFVGLYQINVRVPSGVAAGSSTPLVVSIGGQTSAPVSIATR